MLICLCEGLSDRTLRACVRRGCRTVRQVGEETGAGKHCGSCACDVARLVAQEAAEDIPSRVVALPLAAK